MATRRITKKSDSSVAGRIARADEKPALLEEQRLEEIRSRPIESLVLKGFEKRARARLLHALRDPMTLPYVSHGNISRNQDSSVKPILTIGELADQTENQLARRPMIGVKGVKAIAEELRSLGFSNTGKQELEAAALEMALNVVRSRPVSSLKLEGLDQYAARRAKGSLERRGVFTLGDIERMDERSLFLTKHLGHKALLLIKGEMAALGIPIGGKVEVRPPEPGTVEFERLVSMPIEDLKLPGLNPGRANMARRIWKESGIVSIGDAICRSPSEMRLKDGVRSYGTGRGTVKALTRGLSEHGLRLGMAKEMDEHRLVRKLAMDVWDLIFSPKNSVVRISNSFQNIGLHKIFEVVQKTEADLLAVKYFSRKHVKIINDALQKMGLSLGMELDERTIGKAKLLAGGTPAVLFQDKVVSDKPFIRLDDSGQLETNLSPEQLKTIVRLAKKELRELREDLKSHRIKVIGEFLDIFEGDKKA